MEGGFIIVLSKKLINIGKKWIEKYLSSSSFSNSYIAHHGRKGQKWGIKNGPPYPIKEGKILPHEYEIEDKRTGEKFHLVEGTRIHDKTTFAGKGTKKPLNEEVKNGLVEQLGGTASEWSHCKGRGFIDHHGEEREVEIHWFEEPTVGKHRFKIKKFLDE